MTIVMKAARIDSIVSGSSVFFLPWLAKIMDTSIVAHFLALITEFHLCGLCKKASAYDIKNVLLGMDSCNN